MKRRLTLTACLFATLFVVGCHRESATVAALPTAAVRTIEVRTLAEVRRTELPGTVRAVERAALAPKVTGTITSLPIVLGQTVRKGDTLATITANEINARLAQAEAALAQTRRDLERETGLEAKGASATETVRSMQDRVRIAEATVAEARTMLAYTAINAPFDGVITRRLVNEGDLASAGYPLLEIENPALQRVEVEVPDSLAAVAVGTEVPVRINSLELTGRVAEVSPALDPVARTYLAKIDLPAGAAVRSGQFARVGWPAGEGRALVAPATAVSNFGQMERVFVVTESRASLRLVKTGARHGTEVEILSGLAAGERLVAEPAATLRDGQPVEVKP
ncbi:MAG TPA: efflux RND transporter periplasmic adaptor subunit [Opitutaceae bacterium]|nr:efflux RND transporter periplasmic adaptor subunit [Opitutaceae bacterium]